MALFRLVNVIESKTLLEIWHTLSPIAKVKAQPSLDIACRNSTHALQYKAPRVTYTVAFLLLRLHFHTEDPDYFNNTVNIFQFLELSLYSGSEASMVTRRWDTLLDTNTMMLYYSASTLLKQQIFPPTAG